MTIAPINHERTQAKPAPAGPRCSSRGQQNPSSQSSRSPFIITGWLIARSWLFNNLIRSLPSRRGKPARPQLRSS